MPGQVFVFPTDPGAVGAGRFWLALTGVFIRNPTNTAWLPLCNGVCGLPPPDLSMQACNSVNEDGNRQGSVSGGTATPTQQWNYDCWQSAHAPGAVVTRFDLQSIGVGAIFNFLLLYSPTEIGNGSGSPPLPHKTGTFIIPSTPPNVPAPFTLTINADYLGPGSVPDECINVNLWRP